MDSTKMQGGSHFQATLLDTLKEVQSTHPYDRSIIAEGHVRLWGTKRGEARHASSG